MSVSRVRKSEVASANSSQKGLDIRPFVGGRSCIPLDADMGTSSTGASSGLLVLVHRGEKGVAVVTCLRRRCNHCTTAVRQGLQASPCGSAAFRSRRHSWPDQRCRLTACRIDGMPISTHTLGRGSAAATARLTASITSRCSHAAKRSNRCAATEQVRRQRRYWQLADSDDASSTTERLVNHRDVRQ